MAARTASNRKTWPLIAVCLVVAVLLLLLATIERSGGELACAPTPPEPEQQPAKSDLAQASTPAHFVPPAPLSSPSTKRPPDPLAPSRGVVDGLVLDARTRLSVPWVHVEVSGPGATTPCLVRTRTDGSFTTSDQQAFGDGDVTVRVRDGDVLLATETRTHVGAVGTHGWLIAVPIGPTVYTPKVSNGFPSPREAWQCTLTESPYPFGSAGEIEVRGDELSLRDFVAFRLWSPQPIRFAENSAFVRWPRVEFGPDPRLVPRMTVRSKVESAYGSTELRGTVGEKNATFGRFRSLQVVEGKLAMPKKQGLVRDARIVGWTRGRSEAKRGSPPDIVEVSPVDGAFELEVRLSSPTDTFELAAFAEGCNAVVTTVPTHRGRVAEPELKLTESGSQRMSNDVGWVDLFRGVDDRGQMLLARLWDPAVPTCAVTFWSTGGAAVDAIPIWRYRLMNIAVDEDPVTGGGWWTQTLPAALDRNLQPIDVERTPHRIEWIDDETGLPRQDFEIAAGPVGCVVTTKEGESRSSWMLTSAANTQFSVWRPGSKPAIVAADAFHKTARGVVASVRFRPGWGVMLAFRVGNPEANGKERNLRARATPGGRALAEVLTRPALPGVRVRCGAVELGRSDADGTLLVTSEIPLDHLSLEADGWRLCGLERMSGSGARWIAWMEREP